MGLKCPKINQTILEFPQKDHINQRIIDTNSYTRKLKTPIITVSYSHHALICFNVCHYILPNVIGFKLVLFDERKQNYVKYFLTQNDVAMNYTFAMNSCCNYLTHTTIFRSRNIHILYFIE